LRRVLVKCLELFARAVDLPESRVDLVMKRLVGVDRVAHAGEVD
jgi:hypothetical protein